MGGSCPSRPSPDPSPMGRGLYFCRPRGMNLALGDGPTRRPGLAGAGDSKEDPFMATSLFTSESVTDGHPDKVAGQISDAILDAILTQDPLARVPCETVITNGLVILVV